jgi:putative spermidine/putrescine transport system substrate-binding protein
MERYFRNGVLAAAAGAVVISGAVTAWAAKELVVVSWGGAYSASQQKAYHDPYMAKNPDIRS